MKINPNLHYLEFEQVLRNFHVTESNQCGQEQIFELNR